MNSCAVNNSNSLHDAVAKVVSLQGQIAGSRDERSLAGLRGGIEQTARDAALAPYADAKRLLGRIERRLALPEELTERDLDQMAEACVALRFRLIAASLAGDTSPLEGRFRGQEFRAGMRTERSGLSYGCTDTHVVLLLPELGSVSKCEEVGAELLAILGSPSARGKDWVLDFSAVGRTPSVLFMGLLRAIRSDLEQYGRSMSIGFLPADLFPPEFRARLSAELGLRLVGPYLFTGCL